MPVAASHANPSTLADVIGQVIDLFAATGDATPILVGGHYLEAFGAGSAPRVLFVPDPRTSGRLGPPIELGRAVASITHACDVYARAEETGDDLERFRKAYALGDKVLSALRRAGAGRLEFGAYGDGSPTKVDAYGAEIAFSFTYQRDVYHDVAIMSVPSASPDATPKRPIIPPGTPASSENYAVETAVQE